MTVVTVMLRALDRVRERAPGLLRGHCERRMVGEVCPEAMRGEGPGLTAAVRFTPELLKSETTACLLRNQRRRSRLAGPLGDMYREGGGMLLMGW